MGNVPDHFLHYPFGPCPVFIEANLVLAEWRSWFLAFFCDITNAFADGNQSIFSHHTWHLSIEHRDSASQGLGNSFKYPTCSFAAMIQEALRCVWLAQLIMDSKPSYG